MSEPHDSIFAKFIEVRSAGLTPIAVVLPADALEVVLAGFAPFMKDTPAKEAHVLDGFRYHGLPVVRGPAIGLVV